jgi:hypothetical protein
MKAMALLFVAAGITACGAVYPEITPPLKAPPTGRTIEPPPPRDLIYIDFVKAEIPARTRDGRQWDSGSLPDPFAKFIVNDREIIKTPIQSDTLAPTWPDQKRANYRISKDSIVRVEIWDSNPINNHPICIKKIHDLHEQVGPIPMTVDCTSGAHFSMRVEPAHGLWGLGFSYELSASGAAVSHVVPESPAARGGVRAGDDIVQIQGKKVEKMESGEPQSLINANAQVGVDLLLRGKDGTERHVVLKEGIIYPTVEDDVPLPGAH